MNWDLARLKSRKAEKTMTQLTQQLTPRNSMFGTRILTMALFVFVLMIAQSSTARAQWTTSGTNISNSNTGNVGIGTTSAPAAKLEVSGANVLPRVTNTSATTYGGLELFEGGTIKFAMHTMGSASGSNYVGGANAAQLWNYANSPMVFGTNSNERLRIDAAGNVGMGTTSPSDILHVAGGNLSTVRNEMSTWLANNTAGGETDWSNNAYYSSGWKYRLGDEASRIQQENGNIRLFTAPSGTAGSAITFSEKFTVLQGGNVGIGTTSPTTKLHVIGDITVSGNINAKYQDVAEWVESSQALTAGTVVVLDHTRSNQVIASSQAYDTRIAGVISAQPGITLGERGESKVLVATTGRVKVKVDATAGPIQVGDLLVTSDKEGLAKKSEPLSLGGVQLHRPGTLIGKALEPLAGGRGEILVLLSLQ